MSPARSLVLAFADLDPVVEIARAAEAAGFARVWTTELPGRDALVRAALVAGATSRIGVATGITYAFSRGPLALASAAADLRAAAPGRFALGLGAGTRGLRRRYGTSWEHPAPQFAEYVAALRSLIGPEPTGRFAGEHHPVDVPPFAPAPAVPIYGSGVNRIMLRTCAAVADGVALHALAAAPGYLEEVAAPALRAGAADRDHPPHVVCWLITAVDRDEDAARAAARRQVAFYLSTPGFRQVAEVAGWPGTAEDVRAAAQRSGYRDWDAVAALVPDDRLDELAVAGTPDQVRARLATEEARLAAAGVDEVALQMTFGADAADTTRAGMDLVEAAAPRMSG